MSGAALELMRQHAPLLAIVAPLIGAALGALTGSARASWVLAALASLFGAAFAIDLAWRILLAGAPPIIVAEGLALAPDGVGVFAAAILAATLALAMVAAGGMLAEGDRRVLALRTPLALASGAGWMGALFAQDLITLSVAVEIGWIAGAALTAFGAERDRGALNGALRMLSVGGIGAALSVLGVALLARAVGSFDLAAMAHAHIIAPNLAIIGLGLVMLSLAIKAGAAPLHLWTGAAFGRGGAFPALMLGAVGLVGALAVLMRIAAHALGAPAIAGGLVAGLVALGVFSAVIGSIQAIGARNLPRLAAYAMTAQAGCVLISFALGSQAGIAAALVQLMAIAGSSLALLGGAALVGAGAIATLDGMGRRAPLAGIALMAGALGLMGAPLTITFLGRWRMIEAAVGVGWWWAACAAIAVSLAGVFYGGRLVERVYFRRVSAASPNRAAPHAWAIAPALIVAIGATALGVEPSLLLRAAAAAGAMMVSAAP